MQRKYAHDSSHNYIIRCAYSAPKHLKHMLTLTEHYLSLALFTYIFSCLTFAAVRWFHACRPYDKWPDYYYPGRKLSVLVFLSALIMLPYALNPADNDAWVLLKGCFMILLPFYCAVLMSKYFGTVKQWNKWKRHAVYLIVTFGLTIAALLIVAIVPGVQTARHRNWLQLLIATEGIVSVLFTIYCLMKIYRWLQEVNDENYSNEDDFPEQFASRMIWMVLFYLVVVWTVVVTDSPVVIAVANVVLHPAAAQKRLRRGHTGTDIHRGSGRTGQRTDRCHRRRHREQHTEGSGDRPPIPRPAPRHEGCGGPLRLRTDVRLVGVQE